MERRFVTTEEAKEMFYTICELPYLVVEELEKLGFTNA